MGKMTPDMALCILVLAFWGLAFWLGYKHGEGDNKREGKDESFTSYFNKGMVW